jgi:PAS domain S-box-containing protein
MTRSNPQLLTASFAIALIVVIANALISWNLQQTKIASMLTSLFNLGLLILLYGFMRRDMNARQKAADTLQERENHLRAILDAEPECVKVVAADGKLLEINPAGLAIIDAPSAAAVLGQSVYSLIVPEHRSAFQALNEQVCRGESGSLEFEIISCQGNRRWLETHAVPLPHTADGTFTQLAVTRDITRRKQSEAFLKQAKEQLELRVAERTAELIQVNQQLQHELDERQKAQTALQVSQAQFAGILNVAEDAIISISSQQEIILFNQGAERIFGYTAAEVIGQPLDILLPARFTQPHHQHVIEFKTGAAKARRMGDRREIYGRRKNGAEFQAEASISKLDTGKDTVFTVFLQDITERRQIERMKDEFISVVSHELRTPLTSIHGSLGLLASGLLTADSPQGQRMLQIAVDSTDRLVRLINDILDIERIESGRVKMEPVYCQVDDLITGAVNTVQALVDKAGVTLSVTSLPLQLWVDPDRIVQTLTNLLSNAIKFSPSGNTIWLTVESQSNDVLIMVKDQGRGIPQDKLDSIFERFQQVDSSDSRNHEGTGLGLAICRSIVQQHNGKIWVESVLGEGSSFFFTLPLLHQH